MKQKICILFLSLMISTMFVACSNTDEESSNYSSETSKEESSMIPSPEPDITPDDSSDSMEDYTLEDYAKSVKDVYDTDYVPDMEIKTEDFEEKFGLTSDMYDEIWGESSTLPENPDVFIAVKAKEGMADEVEVKLDEYKTSLIENTEYEAHADKLNAGKVYKNGDYVFFMILGANEFVDTGEDMAQGFKDEIEKGVKALEDMFK